MLIKGKLYAKDAAAIGLGAGGRPYLRLGVPNVRGREAAATGALSI
jgi:hypothetical protein